MGFFSDLFGGGRRREVDRLLNPLLASKLQEFAVVDADDVYMKHYFRFNDRDGKREEFVVIYRRFDPDLHYLRTHYRKAGESFFVTVNETVWSFSISYLIEQGKRLAGSTRPQKSHLAAQVSAGDLKHPDWKPPGKATEETKAPERPQPPNSLLKNLEMESFLFSPVVVGGDAAEFGGSFLGWCWCPDAG